MSVDSNKPSNIIRVETSAKEAQQHSHMSFSLMMPQKYCGFSTKLDKPESSSEEGGLVPKFMKRSDTARSSSVPKTDEPNETGRDANKQK